ncbi:MAG: hypothetical protein JXA14_23750, partial [Anaerolineae bacterium]|nr:hypothetical protein [Anaerolineae bacterium]
LGKMVGRTVIVADLCSLHTYLLAQPWCEVGTGVAEPVTGGTRSRTSIAAKAQGFLRRVLYLRALDKGVMDGLDRQQVRRSKRSENRHLRREKCL